MKLVVLCMVVAVTCALSGDGDRPCDDRFEAIQEMMDEASRGEAPVPMDITYPQCDDYGNYKPVQCNYQV